jgi:ribosomal-protein-alanine N-acetyltransferase
VLVRAAAAADLDAVVAIERVSFCDPPWSRAAFAWLLTAPHMRFIVACDPVSAAVVGYIVTSVVVDEAEIANLAVAPDWRLRGVGARLVDDAVAHAAAAGVRVMYLEVRESNDAARALYRSRAFAPVGRRREYYRNPVEDAEVLERRIGGTGD